MFYRRRRGRVRWRPDGDLEFGFPSEEKGEANLCYDGWTLAREVELQGRKLAVALDTGSPRSEWWPPLARTFPGLAGTLTLRVGGVALTETGAAVNDHPTVPRSAYYFGRLGTRLLDQARRTTIDFRSLRLRLE